MLSHDSHDAFQQEQAIEVTLSLHVHACGSHELATATHHSLCNNVSLHASRVAANKKTMTPSASKYTDAETLECPMCNFTVSSKDDYVLQLHFEQVHTADSPFIIQDDPATLPASLPDHVLNGEGVPESVADAAEDDNTVLCPEPDCCELVPLEDFNDHLDYHAAETLSFDETTGEYHSKQPTSNMPTRPGRADGGKKLKKQSRRDGVADSQKSVLARSILSFNRFTRGTKVNPPANSCRLGRAELGPYAWETRMPRWLHEQLAAGPKITTVNRIGRDGRLIKQEQVQNETPGLIPILAQLSALDRGVKEAYYCHPSTLHIGKTPKEGAFCGYRNIQMLVSYIQGAKAQGCEDFPGRTPGVLKLQDFIERAWDKGINDIGRSQTGGIRDTRKYIGTPEAQAFFLSSQIDCAVEQFCDAPDGSIEAHETLLQAAEAYFAQAAVSDGSRVYKTLLPPIYLQKPGHSLTIIGFERRRDGTANLVIFDPSYSTSPAMHRLLGRKNIKTYRPEVIWAYRRTAKDLRKHATFEILRLTAHPPLFPAWDVLRQFPDCRYLYVFFRCRTLGFDVYPEDHFLRSFPWQQYGGLWMLDDSRFARSDPINPLAAQALRRITGEGASTGLSSNGSAASSLSGNSFHHISSGSSHKHYHELYYDLPSPTQNFGSSGPTHQDSCMPSYDGSAMMATGLSFGPDGIRNAPALDMTGMHSVLPAMQQISSLEQAKLSLLTDVGRRYPGYPTPLSPTLNAKELFPSPAVEGEAGFLTSRPSSPAITVSSRMSNEMCGPSRRYMSLGYDHYAATVGLSSTTGNTTSYESAATSAWNGMAFVPEAKLGGTHLRSSPPSVSSQSPTSPPRAPSPRTAMLKNMVSKQAFQNLSHQPDASMASFTSPSAWPTFIPSAGTMTPNIINPTIPSNHPPTPPISPPPPCYPQLSSTSSPTKPHISINTNIPTQLPQSLPISNGVETYVTSPISPQGTMLSYTSNRPAVSGLLAVRPLSEAQVAEYRFWRPCGRGKCAFGCGGVSEGEWAAARRLFRSVEEVGEDYDEMVWEGGSAGGGEEAEAEREREVEVKVNGNGDGFGKKWGLINLEGRERDGVCEI
ncbi:DUF1671-domain-containing protein [Byssothecium circinans]|uniref:DUF1671-domain-containing protein n=1 Tax=Byssothecium circinans TaxID=147558 RepID=A0A6A5TKI0_9PLEO|nr:DUF1671-domain-containing protein [Byssothecium circinans]